MNRKVTSATTLFVLCQIIILLFSGDLSAEDDQIFSFSTFIEERGTEWINSGWKGELRDNKIIGPKEFIFIIDEHEQWLKTNELNGKRADLSNAKISGAYLSHRNLAWALLENMDATGSDLSGSILIRAAMCNSKLEKVDFMYANLSSADLEGSILVDADLSEADLSGANLRNVRLLRANLRDGPWTEGAFLRSRGCTATGRCWL